MLEKLLTISVVIGWREDTWACMGKGVVKKRSECVAKGRCVRWGPQRPVVEIWETDGFGWVHGRHAFVSETGMGEKSRARANLLIMIDTGCARARLRSFYHSSETMNPFGDPFMND